ncbi:SH3 domain-containing protein [Cytobacillus depressus]|uniref:SH3 domain-containing protein n=1 Tax=Cytobacillus depressus TaxID=1602942 RepID=A0A6L3VB59_9BACI|nr:N-acetylmuramoyl-L-alanine amidase [Cytobacillus depressus]KAB2336752.1 SH3 domain-containing protein [Cytobacillus depressus]
MFKKVRYQVCILVAVCIMVISMGGKGLAATFKDVPDKYSSEIYYLVDRQIITGYPDGTFKPKANVTRDEAITMVGRAIKLNGEKRATSFKDVKVDSYASGYIQSAVERGILSAEANFRPKDKMTRGEMALWLEKAFQLTETSNTFFSDIPTSGSLQQAIDRIVTEGIANGYPDGTFKPNNAITREEFSLLIARAIDPAFRVSSNLTPSGKRVVTADSLNVRSGPGTDYAVLGALPLGTTLTIYYASGDWVYMSYGNLTGFVHRAYLKDPSQAAKRVIAIDAGHGGKDPGAMGNGLQEKEITLSIALKVQKILEQKGVQVVMTRKDDTYLTLDERVNVATRANADTFVSIHVNSNTSSSPSGTETYFSTAAVSRAEQSKQLATFIQNRLYQALGTANRGVKNANFYVIYQNPLPSVLIETGFISNAAEAKKLGSDQYRNLAAEAISLGILDYYNWKEK